MLQFLHWIVYEKKIIQIIELHFFLPGHSKHSNDRFFGLISIERRKRIAVENFRDIENIVNTASNSIRAISLRN